MLFTGSKLVFCSFVLRIAVVTVSVGRSVAQTKKKFVFFNLSPALLLSVYLSSFRHCLTIGWILGIPF
jgi:hypothetical protein